MKHRVFTCFGHPYWFVILFVGSKIFFVTKHPTANNAFYLPWKVSFKSLANLLRQYCLIWEELSANILIDIYIYIYIFNLKMLRLHLYISCVSWWVERPWGKKCFYVLKMPGEMMISSKTDGCVSKHFGGPVENGSDFQTTCSFSWSRNFWVSFLSFLSRSPIRTCKMF